MVPDFTNVADVKPPEDWYVPAQVTYMLGLLFDPAECTAWIEKVKLPEVGGKTAKDIFQSDVINSSRDGIKSIVERLHRAYAGIGAGELPSVEAVIYEWENLRGVTTLAPQDTLEPRQ